MKKRKLPKLVVDNKLPEEDDPAKFTYEEFRVIAEQVMDLNNRYPEIMEITKRARDTDDEAMLMTMFDIVTRYGDWRDILAIEKREKLGVVKRKRD